MPFTIPNEAAAAFADQAEPDSVHFDILAAGFGRNGVVSGGAVTAQATPDMTVAVAAGSIRVGSVLVPVTAGNVTITAANATNPRFDLIVSSNTGSLSAVAGTAAANAVFPAVPANSVVLAAVYVPANDTAIQSNQITDLRILLPAEEARDYAFRVDELPVKVKGLFAYNSMAFTQDNLTTYNNQQYAVFYELTGKPYIAKRSLPLTGFPGAWTSFDLSTVTGNPLASPVADDEHNVTAVAVSSDGRIHVMANMHSNALRYVRSSNAEDIAAWVAGSMVGTEETSVTYPQFFKGSDGTLFFTYRDGASGNGDQYLNKYNAGTQSWSRVAKVIDGKSDLVSAYLHRVAVDPVSGRIHWAWEWRDSGGGATGNHDLSYAYSDDAGVTWRKTDGTAYTLPIRLATAEIIDATPVNTGLTNSGGACVSPNGDFHVIYERDSISGTGQRLFHIYRRRTTWTRVELPVITSAAGRAAAFATASGLVYAVYVSAWGNGRGRVSGIEITPGVAHRDFPLLLLDLHNWEPAFDSAALRDRDELHMILVPSSKAGYTEQYHADNWAQWGAVVAVDLDRIVDVQRQVSSVPEIRSVGTVTGQSVRVLHTAAEESAQGRLLVGKEFRKLQLFARLRARGLVTSGTTLTVQLWEHTDPSTDTLFGRLDFTETTETEKWTPWLPLGSLGDAENVGFVGTKTFRTGSGTVADLTDCMVELGSLVGAA